MRLRWATFALALAACDPGSAAQGPDRGAAAPSSTVVPLPGSPPAEVPADLASASTAVRAQPAPRVGASATVGSLTPLSGASAISPVNRGVADGARDESEHGGAALDARWEWPPRGSARSEEASDGARRKGALEHTVELAAAGRMRMVFASTALPLGQGSELRVDFERQLILWPNGKRYRELLPGTLAALFSERRADVLPLARATLRKSGAGRLLGRATRVVELESPYGSLQLELAAIREAGAGAPLLCRALAELGGVIPPANACGDGAEPEVALAAIYRSHDHPSEVATRFVVRAVRVVAREQVQPSLAPPEAERVERGLPGPSSAVLLSREELASLRGADVGPRGPGTASSAPAVDSAAALVAKNDGDRLMYLLVDGMPAGYVGPGASLRLQGLRGRHELAWRSFLGEVHTVAREVDAAGAVRYPEDAAVSRGSEP